MPIRNIRFNLQWANFRVIFQTDDREISSRGTFFEFFAALIKNLIWSSHVALQGITSEKDSGSKRKGYIS
jgi:hypothetical protein